MSFENTKSCVSKNSKQKQVIQKQEVVNWLHEMKYEEKMKVFSVVNTDLCGNIIKMYEKFTVLNGAKFRLNLREKKPLSNSTISENVPESYKITQLLFLKEIRFYKVQKPNDAMTISKELLSNEVLLYQ